MNVDLQRYSADEVEHLFRLCGFDEQTQTVLRLRFGLEKGTPLSLGDTSALVGITREQVRKIEIKAMRVIETISLKDWNKSRP